MVLAVPAVTVRWRLMAEPFMFRARYRHPDAAGVVVRLVAANAETGNDCGALVLQMVIADETDAAAMAKWEHYKAGTDVEALSS